MNAIGVRGIICKYIYLCKILIESNVKNILSQYILPLSRMNIKCRNTYMKIVMMAYKLVGRKCDTIK